MNKAEDNFNKIVAIRKGSVGFRSKGSVFPPCSFFFFLAHHSVFVNTGDLANTWGPGEHHRVFSELMTELQCEIWTAVWLDSWTAIT